MPTLSFSGLSDPQFLSNHRLFAAEILSQI
jgi:hypothetical protein